jgi:hypothetical protein
MSNGNATIYPIVSGDFEPESGLTKREYFAALAMQGLVAMDIGLAPAGIALAAVKQADDLLRQLSRPIEIHDFEEQSLKKLSEL